MGSYTGERLCLIRASEVWHILSTPDGLPKYLPKHWLNGRDLVFLFSRKRFKKPRNCFWAEVWEWWQQLMKITCWAFNSPHVCQQPLRNTGRDSKFHVGVKEGHTGQWEGMEICGELPSFLKAWRIWHLLLQNLSKLSQFLFLFF